MDDLVEELIELKEKQHIATKDLRQQLSAITDAIARAAEPYNDRIDEIEKELKAQALEAGTTQTPHEYVQVVYRRGSVKWDERKLLTYASTNPEVMQFRSEGSPSAYIKYLGGHF